METPMRKSIWLLALLPLLSSLAIGCVPSTLQTSAFEPRVYPYVPQVGSDPSPENLAASVATVQR